MTYPSSLDVLRTDLTGADDAAVVDHAGLHNAVNAAVTAVQAELGLDPSGAAATVAARLAAIEADSRWTDDRTPTAHSSSHATGGSDALTAADVDAIPASLLTAKGDLLVRMLSSNSRLPVGADGTVLLADSAQAAGIGWGSLGNLLSANVASGTDVLGTTAGFASSNAALESSVEQAQPGRTRSLKVTISAVTGRAIVGGTSTSGTIPVRPGAVYSFLVWAHGGTSTASRMPRIHWWTAAGNVATSVANADGTPQPMAGTGWTLYAVNGVAPPDARFASASLVRTSGGVVGESHYEGERVFAPGALRVFVPPGPPIPALSPWIVESATSGRACFVWDQVNNRPQMVYYDSGWRDISSLLVNGWTGSLFIRRTDNMVMLRTSGLSGAGATSDTIATIPSGFRSEATISQILPANATDATAVRAQMTSAGVLTMARATVTAQSATWSMSTTNALASTLPGDPVGTIPSA